MKYPKIQSLWKREGASYTKEELKKLTPEQKRNRHKFIRDEYSCDEFANIKHWMLTEKIDGMNIRIMAERKAVVENQELTGTVWEVKFAGRTDNACLPPKLLEYLQGHFTPELFEEVFEDATHVTLFGEGFGPKIQSGGYYGKEQRFVLFDVVIGRWWMEYDTVIEMAIKMGIQAAPLLQNGEGNSFGWKEDEIIQYVMSKPMSKFAVDEHIMEGIVARPFPMMLHRNGLPIRFKLKVKDFG